MTPINDTTLRSLRCWPRVEQLHTLFAAAMARGDVATAKRRKAEAMLLVEHEFDMIEAGAVGDIYLSPEERADIDSQPAKRVEFDRSTNDYRMYLGDRFVGYARTYHEGEVTLSQMVYDRAA